MTNLAKITNEVNDSSRNNKLWGRRRQGGPNKCNENNENNKSSENDRSTSEKNKNNKCLW